MSDFTHNFWSLYVAGITLVGILACGLLLWITSRKKVEATADNTTGHVWDEDLTEMNNPMPRWWMWLFVLTMVFGLGYLAAYPGLGNFAGKLGWSTRAEYEAEVAQANAELQPLYARFDAMKPEDMAGDAQAMAIGACRPARSSRARLSTCFASSASRRRMGSKASPSRANA